MKKLVIFDFDGVVVDSEPVWVQTQINYYQTNYGISLSEEYIFPHIGKPIALSVAEILDEFKIQTNIDDAKCIRNEVLKKLIDTPQPIDGIREFWLHLLENGYQIAIGSSSPISYINSILKTLKLDDLIKCEHIFSGQDCENDKPHPDIYLKIIKLLNVKKAEAIIIEDSISGVTAALNAGIDVIAIPHYSQKNQAIYKKANVIITNYSDIMPRFKGIHSRE